MTLPKRNGAIKRFSSDGDACNVQGQLTRIVLVSNIFWNGEFCRTLHVVSEHQIENKANDRKYNPHGCEYTVGEMGEM